MERTPAPMANDIQINESLDAEAFGRALAQNGRVQIPDFLQPASAEMLHNAIETNKNWYLAYTENGQGVESSMDEIRQLQPAQRQKFINNINLRASSDFQYCFVQYYVSEAVKRGENSGHPLHAIEDFINGKSWLSFITRLTGESVTYSDGMVSIYGPGHYLTEHDDTHPDRDRVVAYVISLTKNWNKNWGGHLAFYDRDGNIEQAFVPRFNALNIFTVPQSHAVQIVAPFARQGRKSITGWVHR